ncbi:uncharacterized protein EI90DRAFT_3090969 [Cantharellus anzutake]|uniref:uncharacterized protein n=1 Tax=Cantharellus anzutake TaxID=1750568 RepID=UPI0019073DF5|nr:uncharacterized protein EI90DRAFT_3090969 [Cantharellus anzutake]KAF8314146.1 hypothetical protein EI90DRAFT_3090969 [Cantharellus anzutake]
MADFLQTAVKGPHGIHHFAPKSQFRPFPDSDLGHCVPTFALQGLGVCWGFQSVSNTASCCYIYSSHSSIGLGLCISRPPTLLNTPNSQSGRHAQAVPLDALAPETQMEEEPVHIGGLSVEVTEPAFGNSPGNLTAPQQHLHVSHEIQLPLPNQSAPKRSNLEIGLSCPGRSHPHNT